MKYLDCCGALFEATEEAYLQMVRMIADGTSFLYKDHARPIASVPEGQKLIDFGSMSQQQAQQIIGGF